jgi:hypothetical protein
MIILVCGAFEHALRRPVRAMFRRGPAAGRA